MMRSGSEITIIPSDEYQVTTMVDFGTKDTRNTKRDTTASYPTLKKTFQTLGHLVFCTNSKSLLEQWIDKRGRP